MAKKKNKNNKQPKKPKKSCCDKPLHKLCKRCPRRMGGAAAGLA